MIEVLMCPPKHFTVSYKINPWMNPRRKTDHTIARKQWQTLHDILINLGLKVHLADPAPGLPDMVFTANAGLVMDKQFIVSNFRYPQRQPESVCFSEWAQANGFNVIHLPSDHYFEGEGDALFFGDVLVAGYRFRSDIKSHLDVGKIIDREVLSVELINPEFYHLDTCFCPLDHESALYFPPAFDDYGKKVLERIIPNPIAVSDRDARRFCCNAVVSGQDIVINRCSGELKRILEDLGFTLYMAEFGEFIKAGGSSKCMVLFLRHQ